MAPERRRQLLLALLVVVLAALGYYQFGSSSTAAPSSTSNGRGSTRRTVSAPQVTAPDVHIDALNAEHVKPDDEDRNLFRFKPKPAPPPPPRPAPVALPPPRPAAPASPVTPPIPLKFVMLIKTAGGERIASLNDGHTPVTAKEGDVVLGRYKIWRIGEESVDISYLDGTGRQTIRLSGQ